MAPIPDDDTDTDTLSPSSRIWLVIGLVVGVLLLLLVTVGGAILALLVLFARLQLPTGGANAPRHDLVFVGKPVVTIADFKSCQINEVVAVFGESADSTKDGKITLTVPLDTGNAILIVCRDGKRKWRGPEIPQSELNGSKIQVSGTIIEKTVPADGTGLLVLKDCMLQDAR